MKEAEEPAASGTATIGGENAAVYTDRELRGLPVYGPGGFTWRPRAGQELLVIKRGGEGFCIAGAKQGSVPGLENGEICISSGGAQILLKNSGSVRIAGRVEIEGGLFVNGSPIY